MACDMCGFEEYEVVWDKTERGKQGILQSAVIRDKDGNILNGRNVICKRCGLIYVYPRMTDEKLEEFYRTEYRKIYKSVNSIEAENRHAETAFKIILQDLIQLDINSHRRRLLDIGCSTGRLLALFEQLLGASVEPYGIEPNHEHCNIAKTNGLSVKNVTLESYDTGLKFDIITMLNAMEHVPSPTVAMRKIHGLLDDGGYILISVPDVCNRVINIPMDAFLSNAHLYNFSRNTVTALFAKCGFEVVKMYSVVEEIGQKIYVLGRKAEPKEPEFKPEDPSKLRKFFATAEVVYNTKYQIRQWGFK